MAPQEHLAQEFKEITPWSPTGFLPQKPVHEYRVSKQINLICRKNPKESPKVRKQNTTPNQEERRNPQKEG